MDNINIEALIVSYSKTISEHVAQNTRNYVSESDVVQDFNNQLSKFFDAAHLNIQSQHEHSVTNNNFKSGRIDSKYGHVIIEYKKPGRVEKETDSLTSQIVGYFKSLQSSENVSPERMFGVGFDGLNVLFVRYRDGKFDHEKPQPVSEDSVSRILRALVSVGAKGFSFTSENLARYFGSENNLARESILTFYHKVKNSSHPRVSTLFREWKILFGEVCGYNIETEDKPSNPKISKSMEVLGKLYNIDASMSSAELLFSIHTYYALIMKFIAFEIASKIHRSPSVIKQLLEKPSTLQIKDTLKKIESDSSLFAQLGIVNFLEGDLFSWYLDIFDNELSSIIKNITLKFDEFDISTLSVDPDDSKDLLKELFGMLFPREVRHDLGEYYTPDWLAEFVLNELEYDGNPDKRLLDPACGSGTFLVCAISRAKKWFRENRFSCGYDEKSFVKKISSNIVGFDLNPLAVMAARTNYLIALQELLEKTGGVELPVFLCDSIMTPSTYSNLFVKTRVLSTSVGDFGIPNEVTSDLSTIGKYTLALEHCLKNEYKFEEFIEYAGFHGSENKKAHEELYEKLMKLMKENRNGVWARIIKNAFAPLFVGKFDFVAGNPPWVNWDSLPEGYRKSSLSLWDYYEIMPEKGQLEKMKKGKKDISMLMTYVSHDYYLKEGGKQGFVITQTVFKTKGAGDGFRRLKYSDRSNIKGYYYLRPIVIHDFDGLDIFENAKNKASVFLNIKTSKSFSYPIPYKIWDTEYSKKINTFLSLNDVMSLISYKDLDCRPINVEKPTSPLMTLSYKTLIGIQKVIGKSYYVAKEGVNTGGLNGCFWIKTIKIQPDGNFFIENMANIGKIKVDQVQMTIEPDLVYPLLRGRDVKRWFAKPSLEILITQDKLKIREGIDETTMKLKFPKTYSYLKHFEKELLNRKDRKFYPDGSAFYTMRNVGPYTMSPWKVVWKYIATDMIACVITNIDSISMPDHRLMIVPFESENESYYVCSMLNSSPSRHIVKSYIVSTQISTHVLENVNIPKFNPKDKTHLKLAELSKKAHELAKTGDSDGIVKVEAQIDREAAKIWGITNEELEAIQQSIREMSGQAEPEKEDEE